jgi:TolA-binding protein
VSHSQAKQNQLIAVAAVRGDEQPDAPPLYWKGKAGNDKVDKKELQDFDMAISKALDGDNATAQKQLSDFIATYPKSAMVADAQLTLKKLQETAAN